MHQEESLSVDSGQLPEALAARPGLLGYVLRTDGSFRHAFAAFVSGDQRALLIAGEPGNGKSTLLYDIVNALHDLGDVPLAGISYDAVHGLLFDSLNLPLPTGETWPPARAQVSAVLGDIILVALHELPATTRLLIEAPLIGGRGEAALERVASAGHPLQAVVLHNPHVWRRVITAGQRDSTLAAQADAMLAIRHRFAAEVGAADSTREEQERAIGVYWQHWAQTPHRLVVSWSGAESDAAAAITDAARSANPLPHHGLFPDLLTTRVRDIYEATLANISDLPAFTAAVRHHNSLDP